MAKRYEVIKRYNSQNVNIFDRQLKRRQKQWSYTVKNSDYYDYLRVESANRLVDRLRDITRKFPISIDLGCHKGHILNELNNTIIDNEVVGGIKTLIQCDLANSNDFNQNSNNLINSYNLIIDEEYLPFRENSIDLVMSSMSLHWINDLPSTLNQIKKILKPDGVFIGSLLGGDTLAELRHCFYLAEQERRGGIGTHCSPFTQASDIAALLQSAGFALPTVDVDTVTISYPNVFVLMEHIQRMGEGNATWTRQFHVGRETFLAMAAIYQELYGTDEGYITATFEIVSVIGWSPHESQMKPCSRGSATKSLKDLSSLK